MIARNTAFTFKGKTVDAKEIGKELGVRYVLEGSVQRDQNRVRVNAQLIDAESGAHLWADRFEEDVADLFKLQDQVVARLANTLGYELVKAEAEKGPVPKAPTPSILYARPGLAAAVPADQGNQRCGAGVVRAGAQDRPERRRCVGGRSYTISASMYYGWADPDTDYDAKVLGQANRAIALAPDNLWAYYVKAFTWGFRVARMRCSAPPTPVSPSIQILPGCTEREVCAEIYSADSNKRSPICNKRCD